MDWQRYKALCDTPGVLSRWLLEQTLELVEDDDLAARLRGATAQDPLPKPSDHAGDADTDMFQVDLTLPEVRRVRERVQRAAEQGDSTSGTRQRGLGGFVETWREFETHLEAGGGSGS